MSKQRDVEEPAMIDIGRKEAVTSQELERTQAAWDSVAAGYEEWVAPVIVPLAEQSLARIGLRSGVRLLDVAAGTGALSLPAARLGAHVVATDISPAMIERFLARARSEGLSNVEGRVMDAHALDLEDNTFDVSASQFGVNLLPDLKRGLREMARVTKPEGRVLILAFGPPQKAEFFGLFLGAMKSAVPGFTGPPTDPPPLQFQVANPEKLHQELADAGLKDISVETITFGMELASAEHLWNLVMFSNPMGAKLIAGATEAQRAEVKKVLEGKLRERSGGGPAAVLNTEVNIGIGTK